MYFGHKGNFYTINGTSKAQFGYPFPDTIWRAEPNPEMAKLYIISNAHNNFPNN